MDPDRRSAIARGMQQSTVDATWLRDLLMEAHEAADAAYQATAPSFYLVPMEMAILKLTDRTRSVHYHRTDCKHFSTPIDQRLAVPEQQIAVRGYEPCDFCCKLTIRAWCAEIGIDQSTVSSIIARTKTRIRKANALKLYRALGEEPHPSLVQYVEAKQQKKNAREISRAILTAGVAA
jgi:plasmid maintenance system antidote protein VapI